MGEHFCFRARVKWSKPEMGAKHFLSGLVDFWGVPLLTFFDPTHQKREKRKKPQTGNGNGRNRKWNYVHRIKLIELVILVPHMFP